LGEVLHDVALEEGRDVGGAATGVDPRQPLAAMAQVLEGQGYEPHVEADVIVLNNCPFDTLAKKHTDLVCGLNRDFVQGVAEGLGCAQVAACLEPEPGRCCVKARAASRPAEPAR
jgi:predicted ArsR family transcriptional regulator